MIRKATMSDICGIVEIYQEILKKEKSGVSTTGWIEGVYPTSQTAVAAVEKDEMYVLEKDKKILAAAKINREQMPQYQEVEWNVKAEKDDILVIHTLVVDPAFAHMGYGSEFINYYYQMAKELGCLALRMDTNENNLPARRLYRRLGFQEVGMVPCNFNGIEGVNLVCLERAVE